MKSLPTSAVRDIIYRNIRWSSYAVGESRICLACDITLFAAHWMLPVWNSGDRDDRNMAPSARNEMKQLRTVLRNAIKESEDTQHAKT